MEIRCRRLVESAGEERTRALSQGSDQEEDVFSQPFWVWTVAEEQGRAALDSLMDTKTAAQTDLRHPDEEDEDE